VSIAEAAARKNVHYQTVRRAIARGELLAMRVGRAVIIAVEALERWQPHYERAPKTSKPRTRQAEGSQ
jgi:excisionase family DNA binding protein